MIDSFYQVSCMVKISKSKNGVWRDEIHENCFFKDKNQAELWVAAKVREYEKLRSKLTYRFSVNERKFMDDSPLLVEKVLLG